METDSADGSTNCAANKSATAQASKSTFKFKFPCDVNCLKAIRAPIADYQEKSGTPKDENLAFIELLKTLGQDVYGVVIAVLVMFYSFVPMLDGFLLCLRFILDKVIDIFEAKDSKEKIMKGLLFFGEFVIMCILIVMIISLIIAPVFQLCWKLTSKVWGLFF